ncbi:hypothetical protein C8R45DRAFT_843560, partial [Mycena sanguinolenta]
MSTSALLNDVLPSSVPTLDATGKNFTIFSLRFLTSVEGKGFLRHFDGTETTPTFGVMPLTQAQVEELATWEKGERTSKSLLMQKVPDTIAIMSSSMDTVAKMWTHITQTFTSK